MLESVRQQLFVIAFAALIFLGLTALIVVFTDPFQSSYGIVLFFYVCVIGLSINFFTLLIYAIRSKFTDGLHFKRISISLRESALLTTLLAGLLYLSAHNLFYWWVVLSLVLALVFIEGFFLV